MKFLSFLLVFLSSYKLLALSELNESIKNFTKRIKNNELHITHQKVVLKEIKEDPAPSKTTFKLKRKHRTLDRIARLLSRELSGHYKTASYSVAWVKNEYGQPALAISMKNDYVSQKNIIRALENIMKDSRHAADDTPGNLDEVIKKERVSLKKIIAQISTTSDEIKLKKLKKQYYVLRKKIDQLKLFLCTRPAHKKYDRRAGQFFTMIRWDDVLQIGNKHGNHSELVLVGYVCYNNSILGYIENDRGQKIPYQYIGNSMNTCGSCTALINGNEKITGINNISDENNIAIFTRGHHHHLYFYDFPVPGWACSINKKSYKEILKLMSDSPNINEIPSNRLFVLTTHDVSDSDEE